MGADVSFGLMAFYLTPPSDWSVPGVAISAVAMYLFTAPVEELGMRGYLQNKIVSQVTVGSAMVRTASEYSLLHWRSRCFISRRTCSSEELPRGHSPGRSFS